MQAGRRYMEWVVKLRFNAKKCHHVAVDAYNSLLEMRCANIGHNSINVSFQKQTIDTYYQNDNCEVIGSTFFLVCK